MRTRYVFLIVVALVSLRGVAQTAAAPEVSPETRAAVARLIGDIMVNGQAYEYDRQLADGIGPRLTASANYEQAVKWAQQKFKQMGLANVHTEPFTMPAAWEPEVPAVGRMTAPRIQQLHIYSFGWSPSTNGELKGNVYYVPHLVPVDKLDAAKIRGSFVLLDRDSLAGNGTGMQGLAPLSELFAALGKLHEMGAQAVLFPGNTNGSESASSFTFTGNLSLLPVAQLGREDELLLKRLIDSGQNVALEFSFKNRVRENVHTENVVAEIKGTTDPDSVVIVGGHLDSWHPGTGAQDNGTGATGVMEVARAVQVLGRPPRRTMRFILFGGEEEGLVGSTAYTKAHKDEMSKIDAVIITDTGSEPAKGYYLMGRNDEKAAMAPIEPLLAGLGGDKTTDNVQYMFQTDHIGMEMMGVPDLVLWTSMDKYSKLHHKASDTFDSVVQGDFTQGVAVLAVTSYAIADSPQAFAKHLSHEEVETMLKDAKQYELYEDMRKMGVF